MPQFGGITTHSSRAAKFVDTVTKHLIKAGKAFNRKVLHHKAKKSIGKPSKASKRITKSVHKRSISKASPQRHIPSPARPVVTNRPPASVPTQPAQRPPSGQPFIQNHTPVAQPSPPPPSGQPVHQNPSPASPAAPAAPAAQPLQNTGAGAALYENRQFRSIVARERVFSQFEHPQGTSESLKNRAWANYNEGQNSGWGQKQALLAKAGQLGQVSASIAQHDKALDQPLARGGFEVEDQGRRVIDNLQRGVGEIDQLMRQQGHMMPPSEYQELGRLRHTLLNEQKLMLQIMEDPGAAEISGSLDLRQAMELKRVGYDLNKPLTDHFSALDDSQLVKGSEVKFGSGALHSVTKLTFNTPSGTVDKVFKADDPLDPCPMDTIIGSANYLDKNKPRFAARSFAGAKFDNILGTRLMPKMEWTVHDGKLGMLMDVAKGVKPYDQDTNSSHWIPVEDYRQPHIASTIQQQLNSAEWLDGICCQQDRHPGNLFIDRSTGKVTLIDNDMGFYPGQTHVRSASGDPGYRRFAGSTAGLPPVIDASVYQKLMSITSEQVRQEMDGLLTPREIESTISRVQESQHHASQLAKQGRVIQNWQQWRDPATGMNAAQVQRQTSPDCYMLAVQGQTRGLGGR